MNRRWLCSSFLTSHKIDCGVVAMVTKISENGVSVGGDSHGDNACACCFFVVDFFFVS